MTTTDTTAQLGETSFDNLAVFGQKDRLHEPGISLCGSRAAGERGISMATAVGRLAAQLELPLVSGYAKGADLAGHVACIEAGGHTIAVLAEGLGRFRLHREIRAVLDPWDDEVEPNLTAVSEFESSAHWTVWRAMRRNATICELGQVLVAIDPGEKGGTLDAVKKAIKRSMPVVIAWSDPTASSDHLAKFQGLYAVSMVETEEDLINAVQSTLACPDSAIEPAQLTFAME